MDCQYQHPDITQTPNRLTGNCILSPNAKSNRRIDDNRSPASSLPINTGAVIGQTRSDVLAFDWPRRLVRMDQWTRIIGFRGKIAEFPFVGWNKREAIPGKFVAIAVVAEPRSSRDRRIEGLGSKFICWGWEGKYRCGLCRRAGGGCHPNPRCAMETSTTSLVIKLPQLLLLHSFNRA